MQKVRHAFLGKLTKLRIERDDPLYDLEFRGLLFEIDGGGQGPLRRDHPRIISDVI